MDEAKKKGIYREGKMSRGEGARDRWKAKSKERNGPRCRLATFLFNGLASRCTVVTNPTEVLYVQTSKVCPNSHQLDRTAATSRRNGVRRPTKVRRAPRCWVQVSSARMAKGT